MDDVSSKLPVIIVGAGPVGLSLAVSLIRKGIKVKVFEAEKELPSTIRASTFHPKTLEMLSEWGVVDKVLEKGQRVKKLQYWQREGRKRLASFDYSLIDGDTDFPYRVQCPQHIYTRTILPEIQSSPLAEVFFGAKLIGFEDRGATIAAEFDSVKGRSIHCGSLLCGADGANSFVRRKLGMGFDGKTYEDRFLLLGTHIDLDKYFPGMDAANYVFDPKEWIIVLKLPDITRIVYRVDPGETDHDAKSAMRISERLVGFLGEDLSAQVETVSIYKVHQRVADSFVDGRIVLLGDAAHINNPTAGMGMNSGIHDAALLGDKIADFAVDGDLGHLVTYADMRRSYALSSIQAYTDKRYREMAARSDKEIAARNTEYQDLVADSAKARAFLLRASMLEDRV